MISLIRTEFTKAARRTRTAVIALLLVGLPILIVVAINSRGDRPRRGNDDDGPGLFRLATQSGLLVPTAVLSVTSAFLLIVIAGMFAGDSVASDANWGNLRYLLMRPVPRGRLLAAKAFVAGVLIWGSVILVTVAGLVSGLIMFGYHDVTVPGLAGVFGGYHLSTGALLLRLVIAAVYVAFGFTALLAMGTLFSVLTDTAASAIGATVGVYIVSGILDQITQLGVVRYAFPTHYNDAWERMFTDNTYPRDMVAGIAVQLAYFVVFGTVAVMSFRRRDIRS
jgi:ABC-2 type transport system permease protein